MKRFLTVQPLLLCAVASLPLCTGRAESQTKTQPENAPVTRLEPVVATAVTSGELIGPYEQPRWSARGRFSADTDVYVLPPWEVFLDLDYQLTVPRHGTATNLFTQEFEVGLPWRLQFAYESNFEIHKRRSQETEHTFEARWALADWGKIPLNPTLFAEYKIGVGHERESEAEAEGVVGEQDHERETVSTKARRIPDAYELRLLLGEQFGEHWQWALNVFNEQQIGGSRETETGFSQALSYSVRGESLRIGAEMQFIRSTDRETRSEPTYEFDIGPSIAWKPSRRTRLDAAALFGTTVDSPALKLFAIFSIAFGAGAESEGAAPVSTQNR